MFLTLGPNIVLQDRGGRTWHQGFGGWAFQAHGKVEVGGCLQRFSLHSIPWRAANGCFLGIWSIASLRSWLIYSNLERVRGGLGALTFDGTEEASSRLTCMTETVFDRRDDGHCHPLCRPQK